MAAAEMASFEESSTLSTQPKHHERCSVAHRRKFPGKANSAFQRLVYDRPRAEFPEEYLNCLGCCFAYLTTERGYRKIEVSGSDGSDFVHFCIENVKVEDVPNVWCIVKCPDGRPKSGQIFVEKDKNKGKPVCRAIENHRTYQIYYTKDGNMCKVIGSGCDTFVRLESVAVNAVTRAELSNLKMSYVDAVLFEIYIKLNGSSDRTHESFKGTCVIVKDAVLQELENQLRDTKVEDDEPSGLVIQTGIY